MLRAAGDGLGLQFGDDDLVALVPASAVDARFRALVGFGGATPACPPSPPEPPCASYASNAGMITGDLVSANDENAGPEHFEIVLLSSP